MQDDESQIDQHNLIYANVTAPWSSFICGSQGSGKSHTLSCLLENTLIASSPAGRLSSPLAGLVLHYDKFTAYGSTQLCEAVYLCSSGIPVRILVSPTNYIAMFRSLSDLATSPEAGVLTETLLSIIRQQRHLGARVMIATQEPTVSPVILDLCNVTIIHRFTSPAWFQAIKKHIAGATMASFETKSSSETDQLFHRIVRLKTGEALVFCLTALLDAVWSESASSNTSYSSETDVDGNDEADETDGTNGSNGSNESDEGSDSVVQISPQSVLQLGPGCFHLRVRKRVTVDGGRSHLAK